MLIAQGDFFHWIPQVGLKQFVFVSERAPWAGWGWLEQPLCLPKFLPGDPAGFCGPGFSCTNTSIHRAICTWRGNWARRRSGPVSVFSQKDCLWTDVLWCFSQKMDSGERKCLSITEVLCITAIFNLESESLKVLDKILSTVTTFFVSSQMQPEVICKVPTVRLWGDLSAGKTEFSTQLGVPDVIMLSQVVRSCCL